MDKRDLEELDLGIELALDNQEQAAHFIFSRLRDNNPDNSSLLALCAYTAPDPAQAQAALETAMHLDPANPLLPGSRAWLEENKLNKPKPSLSPARAIIAPARLETAVIPAGVVATLPIKEAAKPPQSAKLKAKPPQPANSESIRSITPFSRVWWVRLAFSLLFFGSAMTMIYMLVTANNLNESEKAYFNRIGQLNQQTKEVNTQIQSAVEQFNAGKLPQPELVSQLRRMSSLDDEFMTLKSPSSRFDKLDGLLGQAFSYFNEGATSLINGLEASDTNLINDGNHMLIMGNDYLRQARDELKALGG